MNNLNGWLNIDKPSGVTSNYISTVIKRILGIKKHGTKLGFVGTLDPFATGLLTFAIGNATKCIDLIPNHYKAYEFSVEWGKHTDSYDVDGSVISTTLNIPEETSIINESQKFIGITLQSPPVFSAVKIKGRRAYDLAREGKNFVTTPKNITIKDFHVTSHNGVNTTFFVRCSKGCYIRSLAVDLAKKLNSICFVKTLRRVEDGFFSIKDSIPIDLLKKLSYDEITSWIEPVDKVLDDIPAIRFTPEESNIFLHGGFVTAVTPNIQVARIYNNDSSRLIGFSTVVKGVHRPKKVFIGDN